MEDVRPARDKSFIRYKGQSLSLQLVRKKKGVRISGFNSSHMTLGGRGGSRRNTRLGVSESLGKGGRSIMGL